MKVLNVNSTLGLNTGGGTAERTFQMSRYFAISGIQTTVLTLDIEITENRRAALLPANLFSLPTLWKRFYVPYRGFKTIMQLVKNNDIIHLMGHWSVLNTLVYFAARVMHKPYVVCPAGALPLFGRSRILKRIYNFLFGYSLIRKASGWIAVTEMEIPHFESYGIIGTLVKVLPNGVTEEDFVAFNKQEFLEKYNLPDVPYILFMGRLNPIKGPDLLLKAFIKIRADLENYHLIFAGPDGGLLSELQNEALNAGVTDSVHFIGYIADKEKSTAYHLADILVISSRQEAMSIVALEAGICSTVVLLTNQCGFSEIKNIDPRLEVDATVDGIADGLKKILSDKNSIPTISPKWRDFVYNNYTWNKIIGKYILFYKEILKGFNREKRNMSFFR